MGASLVLAMGIYKNPIKQPSGLCKRPRVSFSTRKVCSACALNVPLPAIFLGGNLRMVGRCFRRCTHIPAKVRLPCRIPRGNYFSVIRIPSRPQHHRHTKQHDNPFAVFHANSLLALLARLPQSNITRTHPSNINEKRVCSLLNPIAQLPVFRFSPQALRKLEACSRGRHQGPLPATMKKRGHLATFSVLYWQFLRQHLENTAPKSIDPAFRLGRCYNQLVFREVEKLKQFMGVGAVLRTRDFICFGGDHPKG